jgi:Flp pilus assembly CpaF family ATPase
MLNCLTAAVPARERVITCEEVFELKVPLPDVVRMQTRQPNLEGACEISLRHLVREALRMRPQRIVGMAIEGFEMPHPLRPRSQWRSAVPFGARSGWDGGPRNAPT